MYENLFRHLKTSVPSCSWPAMHVQDAASMMSLQYQFAHSERMPDRERETRQLQQAFQLARFARQRCDFYRNRIPANLPAEVSLEAWRTIPVLERADLQQAGERIIAEPRLPNHSQLSLVQTSGSTGQPVRAWGTPVTGFFWLAFTLREHLWQGRDFSGKLMSFRPEKDMEPGARMTAKSWGPATDTLVNTGPAVLVNSRTPIHRQAELLLQENPDYLHSLATNLKALVLELGDDWKRLTNLKGLRSYGEICSDELRELVRERWGLPVADTYSSQELGYIANPCEHQRLHVQAEGVLVEILDEQQRPCRPGEVGRVVVTSLQNYGAPLIRYAIGDHAEQGESCACGRTLPVLARVYGRTRNMVTLPDGSRHWPTFPASLWNHLAEVRQLQLVQTAPDRITIRVAADQLSATTRETLAAMVQERTGYPFEIDFEVLDEIPRSKGGKFEDFISQL